MCPRCQKRHAQGKPLDCPECEVELQRTAATAETPSVDAETTTLIQESRSGGQPLPASTRSSLEPRFGYGFGDVRVHTDSKADEAARAVGAQAFTLGRDIVFRDGAYRPETASGTHLLAHELTHVVQQRGHTTPSVIRRKEPESKENEQKPKPGTAAAGPKMALQKSKGESPCACLVVIHNNEPYVPEIAKQMHARCAYNLVTIPSNKRTRKIRLASGKSVDPNAMFPRTIAEQCLKDEAKCKAERDQLRTSKSESDIERYTQLQFFLTLNECSDSFSLPVVSLHNNDLIDTQEYHKQKAKEGVDLSNLQKDFEKPGTDKTHRARKKQSDGIKKKLEKLLDETVGSKARKDLDIGASGKTNIFRWCVSTDLSRCHIGDPENPDNVVWVTDENDYQELSKKDVNVVLQSEPPTRPSSESEFDLSTLFVHLAEADLKSLVAEFRRQKLAAKAQGDMAKEIQSIMETYRALERLQEHGDALLGDYIRTFVEISKIVFNIIKILLGAGSKMLKTPSPRYINIETPLIHRKDQEKQTLTPEERVANYEFIVTVLESIGLHCCDDPTDETNIKNSLREGGTR